VSKWKISSLLHTESLLIIISNRLTKGRQLIVDHPGARLDQTRNVPWKNNLFNAITSVTFKSISLPLFLCRMRSSLLGTILFFSSLVGQTSSSPSPINHWFQNWKSTRHEPDEKSMGQAAVQVMTYDRAANVVSAVPALTMLGNALSWYRLDDGVMGGQSQTMHSNKDGVLHFNGIINTGGGGFASIRAKIPPPGIGTNIEAIRLRFRGDGKTYKFIVSDGKGSSGGPFARSPSWQVDLPTENQDDSGEFQEVTIPLNTLRPVWGGRASSKPSEDDKHKHKFDPTEMKEIGLMLSLLLSDGTPNPKETFGEGIFPFSLFVDSMELMESPSTVS
jgi:Complex I intermediate-associated protein 30 (CIA30)